MLECPSDPILVTTVAPETTTMDTDNSVITSQATEILVTTTTSTTRETMVLITSTFNDGERNSTKLGSPEKDPSVVPIVAGVVGGVVVLSIAIVVVIWRKGILARLGYGRSNRIATSTSYKSTPDGSVQINLQTQDRAHLI